MDKFGIFNLIGSLLTPKQDAATPNQVGGNASNTPLSTIISALSNQKSQPAHTDGATPPPPSKEPKTVVKPTPLQSSMLGTIKSHDEFIKRVKEKSKA